MLKVGLLGAGVTCAKPEFFFLERYMRAYCAEWDAIVQAVLGGTALPVSLQDGINALALAEAATRSAQTGETVGITAAMLGGLAFIKTMSGVHQPTRGSISFEGKPTSLATTRDAMEAGIATVFQDLAMIPLMSVVRNFFMGREPVKGWGPFRCFDVEHANRVTMADRKKMGIPKCDPTSLGHAAPFSGACHDLFTCLLRRNAARFRARNLALISDLAEAEGQVFTLENLNPIDHPDCPFGLTADVLALVFSVNRLQLRIDLDLYHTQIGEGDLIRWCEACLPWIGEVQVADNPGRCEPGTGEINYAGITAALKKMV